jgi:mannosyl-oligosaccharide glucosidase
MYADYGLHTDHVQLQRVPIGKPTPQQPQPPSHMVRQVTRQSDVSLKYVKHFGYVSLFPLMTRVLNPQSSKLEKILNDLQNPSLLWTQYGLRSLAQSSPLYAARNTEHDPPYWRGNIHIFFCKSSITIVCSFRCYLDKYELHGSISFTTLCKNTWSIF